MLRYFSYIDYYCNDRFSTSDVSASDALKMATQTEILNVLCQEQNRYKQKSQDFSNLRRKKKIIMRLFT